ncbi:MAG TPA: molybdopterin-dependent oxidoreductase [Polaromonas sp.]|uniref:molybdopterin-dependent oxidoreductase n=1 Tax=Polaromonas sp. TaxID=1869339 RepID=UPI002D377D9A|nr:molybdopterin-dependent oxidoreductase [Polaromonas sp.]HYW57444.1 molybdopterin-dependent oxidoreductase [Polaromonas sp.]
MTERRQFLSAAAVGVAMSPSLALSQTSPKALRGPALLTVSGLIGRGNRGPLDPVRDQMMVKQKISFDKAHAFDFAAITALPAVAINPTLEYDGKRHLLKGPLLLDVLKACGVQPLPGTALLLRAVDGYAARIAVADAVRYRFIVATHLDGQPMALGGLGPLWAVYDADRFPDMAAKPLSARFALCPWATYHIEVKEA